MRAVDLGPMIPPPQWRRIWGEGKILMIAMVNLSHVLNSEGNCSCGYIPRQILCLPPQIAHCSWSWWLPRASQVHPCPHWTKNKAGSTVLESTTFQRYVLPPPLTRCDASLQDKCVTAKITPSEMELKWCATYGLICVKATDVHVFLCTSLPSLALPLTMQYGTPILRQRAGRKTTSWEGKYRKKLILQQHRPTNNIKRARCIAQVILSC